ncbi:P-loop NTPase fold protein [Candidatus Albibeggiatoa sp. nov. BB20]|uniref:KAP family P-loop NTPase fold protein n=1 Tax=Candidatus Albibeggiatoa sp. nov. BB20 TaxID=3162723 RepID=UPI003365AD7E
MKLITPPLEIDETNPFNKEDDIFNRKSHAEALTNLVINSDDALVISLDGQWGEGKTTFVKMWQGLLEQKDVPNIYIDAFANDYVDDAFIAIASEITSYADEHKIKGGVDEVIAFQEKAKKVGVQLLSWSAKTAIKAMTLGAIRDADIEELKNIQGDIEKGASSLIEKFIDDRLTSHAQNVELIKAFKDELSELPSKLKKGDKPLVIIIDELDRCRPTFAVEIIEKIKHLFSVENVMFVLVMNKAQLEESIKSIYGQNIDAHTYLQKFINLEMKMPKKMGKFGNNDLKIYAEKLTELHELEDLKRERYFYDFMASFSNHFNLSLRQLEKVFSNLAILMAAKEYEDVGNVYYLAARIFVSVVKVAKPKIFTVILYEKISYSDISYKLELDKLYNKQLVDILKYCLLTSDEFQALPEGHKFKKHGRDYSFAVSVSEIREQLILNFAQQLNFFESID